ncbi:hypothetical protein ABDK00_001660 [Niabella insulamsoli]|uniref:hypothetical protein n=1 Tax=Niabella insulamsoli TaxID=3144874 RepID=UPI0031FDC12D
MYLGQITGEIEMGGYRLNGFHSCEIKQSVHQIVQAAKIEIPASAIMRNNDKKEAVQVADKIKEGDPITIAFGYDYKNAIQFTGYIRRIDKSIPVVLECEDAVYLFRKTNIKKTFNSSLKEVLNFLVSEVNKVFNAGLSVVENVPVVEVKNFVVNDQSALWALQQLKDWYPMFSIRLKGNRLHAGLLYNANVEKIVKYAINGPANNTINVSELKYNTVTQTVKVIWEITKPDGTIEKKQFGDSNGELVVKKKINGIVDNETLRKMADSEITQRTYIGFKGSFETFLIPEAQPDMIAHIDDPQFNRNGNYYIGTVTKKCDTAGGIRQQLDIDFKLR